MEARWRDSRGIKVYAKDVESWRRESRVGVIAGVWRGSLVVGVIAGKKNLIIHRKEREKRNCKKKK